MSLIKCPECGNEFSDKASSCPKCGFPIGKVINKDKTKISTTLGIILSLLGVFLIFFNNDPIFWILIIIGLVIVIKSRSKISNQNTKDRTMSKQYLINYYKQNFKNIIRIILLLVLIIVTIFWWYISILVIPVIWFINIGKIKKFNLSKKQIKISTIVISVIVIIISSYFIYENRSPSITFKDFNDGQEVQSDIYKIIGTVDPSTSKISVNGVEIENDGSGSFAHDLKLPKEINNFIFSVTNNSKTTSEEIIIKRIFTPEEIVEMERIATEKEAKRQADIKARQEKAKAELEAYYRTPAGKICKAHPEWSKNDCELLAERKIWIGMEYDMVKYLRGLPRSVNTSNYGYGNEYQACWDFDYNPSCFYFGEDGIIDSYN